MQGVKGPGAAWGIEQAYGLRSGSWESTKVASARPRCKRRMVLGISPGTRASEAILPPSWACRLVLFC